MRPLAGSLVIHSMGAVSQRASIASQGAVMRVSVGEGDLHRILCRFRAVPGARVAVTISAGGLDIVANAEGYRTLARWCLIMAHADMQQAHPRWLYSLLHLDDQAAWGDFASVVWRDAEGERQLSLRDIGFYRVRSASGNSDSQ